MQLCCTVTLESMYRQTETETGTVSLKVQQQLSKNSIMDYLNSKIQLFLEIELLDLSTASARLLTFLAIYCIYIFLAFDEWNDKWCKHDIFFPYTSSCCCSCICILMMHLHLLLPWKVFGMGFGLGRICVFVGFLCLTTFRDCISMFSFRLLLFSYFSPIHPIRCCCEVEKTPWVVVGGLFSGILWIHHKKNIIKTLNI